jgi:hypothetical protein
MFCVHGQCLSFRKPERMAELPATRFGKCHVP